MKYWFIYLIVTLCSTSVIAQIDTIAYNDSKYYSDLISKVRKVAEKNNNIILTSDNIELNDYDKKVFFERMDTVIVCNEYSIDKQITIIRNVYDTRMYKYIYLDKNANKLMRIVIQKELITSDGVYAFDEIFWIHKKNNKLIRFKYEYK